MCSQKDTIKGILNIKLKTFMPLRSSHIASKEYIITKLHV